MKAKELYQTHFVPMAMKPRVDQANGVGEILNALILEIKKIAEARGSQSNGAMLAIIDEQERKWWAVVKFIVKSNAMPDDARFLNKLFETYVSKLLPEVHSEWMRGRAIEMKKKAPPKNIFDGFDDDLGDFL